MQIMKRFVPSYWLVKWLQSKGCEFESTCVLFFTFIRFVTDVPRPLRNEILDHYFKKLMRNEILDHYFKKLMRNP